MPGKDGTGPLGAGKGFGRGRNAEPGAGRGRMGGPVNAGPLGFCECPNCGEKVKHVPAEPCTKMKCPKCGTTMVRV